MIKIITGKCKKGWVSYGKSDFHCKIDQETPNSNSVCKNGHWKQTLSLRKQTQIPRIWKKKKEEGNYDRKT